MMKKVSIITPCFNSEKTIRDTMESVLGQTYPNIEYIIVDGGSTDATMRIVKEYEAKFKGRLRYLSEKDKGIYNAMNKGIRMSTGNIIGIINSDDYYEIDTVERVMENRSRVKYQVIYGYLRCIDKHGSERVLKARHLDIGRHMIAHPTCFVTRSVYRDYGLFIEWLRIASDYELMMRLSKHDNVEFTIIEDVLANFRLGGASSGYDTAFEASLVRFLYGQASWKELRQEIVENLLVK